MAKIIRKPVKDIHGKEVDIISKNNNEPKFEISENYHTVNHVETQERTIMIKRIEGQNKELAKFKRRGVESATHHRGIETARRLDKYVTNIKNLVRLVLCVKNFVK